MNTIQAPPLKSDWCYVGLDETRFWNIPERFKPYLERIITIYAVNRHVHTHCCELQPSYWLECVTFDPVTKLDTPDTIREEIFDWVLEAPAAEACGYHHVAEVEHWMKERPQLFHRCTRDLDPEEPNDAGPPDWVFEYWNSNPRF